MRLLKLDAVGGVSLTEDLIGDAKIPPYAILSHTWTPGQEVTFDDIKNNTGQDKAGYEKIQFCAQHASRDGLHHFWVDTCCINKADHVELQDAINSMFRWYHNATVCYVYLSDVSIVESNSEATWGLAFEASRWFTRGWTLQELLAPRIVEFFSQEGQDLGDKVTLAQKVCEITGVSLPALQGTPLDKFGIEERLSWAKNRNTTRKEDKAYSLLGIFGIYMSMNYGEGEENAFRRLRSKIDKSRKEPGQPSMSTQTPTNIVSDVQEPSQTSWVVPFTRPQSFVGREAQLAQISAHIAKEDSQRLAIYGLGGCGKTVLALEAIYQAREREPTRAVFWVPAVSRETFIQAYQKIGMCLRIAGIEDDNADVKQLVKTRLSDESVGSWLLIIDNADDTSILFDTHEEGNDADQLINSLPQSRKGSIIFTTRTRAAAVQLVGNNVIPLGELDKTEAMSLVSTRLFQKSRHQLDDQETVDKFLSLLSFFALALVQAVAFINTNGITLSEYIIYYTKSEREAFELLSKEFQDQSRYRETKNPVATTWYISFEQVRAQCRLAADYLSFMACTGNIDIPATMLPDGRSHVEQAEAVGTLKAYAFISERQQKDGRQDQRKQMQTSVKAFDVHPLVHLAMRSWLKAHQQWNVWAERSLARLVEIIPYGDHTTREIWTPYLPHAMRVVYLPEVYNVEKRLTLLDKIGMCEKLLGRYNAAEQVFQELSDRTMDLFGKEHEETLRSMNQVGSILLHQGRYREAEQIHRETLGLRKKLLGKKHYLTLASRNNLAISVLKQGMHEEAEQMYRKTLKLEEKVMGKEHYGTLTTRNNLATVLRHRGKYEEAEYMHRETLALRKRVLGREHPDTLKSMNTLADSLDVQGKLTEAERLNREVLAIRNRVVGREHPDTLYTVRNLASLLERLQRVDESLTLYQRAYTGYREILGEGHRITQLCSDDYHCVLRLSASHRPSVPQSSTRHDIDPAWLQYERPEGVQDKEEETEEDGQRAENSAQSTIPDRTKTSKRNKLFRKLGLLQS